MQDVQRSTLNIARLGLLEYRAALNLQDALVKARLEGRIADTLLILEHPHVYTLGRGASEFYLKSPKAGVPVHRVSRGGQVTYHGPGQLIGYPILKLEGAARDVHAYLRDLEQTMIGALGRCGISADRRRGLTGVWVGPRKIASIGVGIRRWVTLHGFALNVCPDLSYFDGIVACGIDGCVTTSMAAEGRGPISVDAFAGLIETEFAATFRYRSVEVLAASSIQALSAAELEPTERTDKMDSADGLRR